MRRETWAYWKDNRIFDSIRKWAYFPDPDKEHPLFDVMFRSVLHGARNGLFGGLVMAGTIAWMFWNQKYHPAFILWFCALVGSVLLRFSVLRNWERRDQKLGFSHAYTATISYLLVGIIWGLAGWVLNDGATNLARFALLTCQYLLMVMSVIALSGYLPVFIAFATPLSFLIPFPWMTSESEIGEIVLVGTLATFIISLNLAARHARTQADTIKNRYKLEAQHAQLRELEKQQILSEERQRLMQDMHDGFGSSLASALRISERGKMNATDVTQVLKDCLEDMKLAVDSMEPVDSDLLLLLATLRYRMNSRLESTGITLHWMVKDIPALEWLNPGSALHILRILQESFANIIKHADATEIHISTQSDNNHVTVFMVDNGQGFATEAALMSGGKGLSNQLRRAKSIGANIKWESSSAGTSFALLLPIRHPTLNSGHIQ